MNNIPHIVDTGASVMNEPVAYLMVERNDGNSYIQMGVPTRDEKISHHPYPLYMHQANESFDRTASHMAGEYVSYNEPVAYAMFRDGEYYDAIHPDEQAKTVGEYNIPLYTHPVKELTDEEITEIFDTTFEVRDYEDSFIKFARAILRKAQE
jgi:hypothetical protein